MTMKHYRYILLMWVVLLTASSVQAQYLNFYGSKEQGSIPLAALDSISFSASQSGRPYDLTLYYDKTRYERMSPTDVDSLTITENAMFAQIPEDVSKAYVRYTESEEETRVIELIPAWEKSGLFHTLVYEPIFAYNIEYSSDQQSWTQASTGTDVLGEGWVQMVLDLRSEGYLTDTKAFYLVTNRSASAKRGIVFVTGAVTGGWDDANTAWKLSMPVNADGWWASPPFVADGEVRAYVKVGDYDWWNTEFTIHEGKIFWRDSDLPNSWAANKGSDYSVQGRVGEKLYVNFTTGEAMVSTPDKVPFPLENPVFRSYSTVDTDSDDPALCNVSNNNTANLFWNSVDGASGYRIKMALANDVSSGGAEVWEKAENILLDQTVDANTTQLSIPNLNYNTSYRFSIQALSPRGEQYNSAWFGYGNGRYWYAYLELQTENRYEVPHVVSVSDVTKTSMRVNLNTSIAEDYTDGQQEGFRQHFNFVNAEKTQLRVDYLTVQAGGATPDAVVPAVYAKYELSEADLARGYVDIEGLSASSTYIINAWDETIAAAVDACYNAVIKTTKGDPDAPMLINHVATDAEYNSMALDDILNEYISGAKAENQEFLLEGGKAYHISSNVELYKGLTLRTNPTDVAEGKRAKLYFLMPNGSATNFMLGRTSAIGESALTLDIDQIRFLDLDIEVPQAKNYGDGGATSNYFMNTYGSVMAFNLNLIEWKGCSFQGFIRGFFRLQGNNAKNIHNIKLIDSDFYNCGYYSVDGNGYGYIHTMNTNAGANALENVEVSGCVFYDNPQSNLITDNNKNIQWDSNVRWNIDVHHNTFVNYSTLANYPIIYTAYIPGGSKLGFHDNVVILTKDAADENRAMRSAGWRVNKIVGGDNSELCTFNISNNWTTNDDYLTNGQPFASYALNATNNAPGKWASTCTYPAGTDELTVHLDQSLKATELMASPNPQHFKGSTPSALDHHTDTGIDGLYYQQTDKVKNSDIYKSGAGCQRLVNGK